MYVVGRDRGVQPLESSTVVNITVINANSFLPKIKVIFLSPDGRNTVSEDAQVGDLVARISVRNPETRQEYRSPVNMSLSGGFQHFGLQPTEAAVFILLLAKPIDREVIAEYSLQFLAADSKVEFLNR